MKGFSSFARTVALAAVLSVPVTATAAETLDLNQASAEELVQLDGIGPVYAERIVDYRDENGPFDSVDQLTEVNGIGPKTLDDLRDQLLVDD
ncbi:ComEA family DNA-binding protein [Guyparkeria sp.]|uniref:ComEA family DNA-binding protein n=1 Tax=Guyparkeria sp. TaxID=2035736 RepID=UPI003970824C